LFSDNLPRWRRSGPRGPLAEPRDDRQSPVESFAVLIVGVFTAIAIAGRPRYYLGHGPAFPRQHFTGIFHVPIGATGGALDGIAVRGVLAIQVYHEERDGIDPVADGVSGDPNLALFAERADQGEEMLTVLVGGEKGLFVVAALGEMQPVIGWRESKSACHFALRR